ncbi:hypothetical protein ACROYT_G017389 [Oculina patagonica]
MYSFPECIAWLAVGLTECVAIVTLNIITTIVFMKNCNLRKRSTYLVINLAVVDMLAGGFATIELFYLAGAQCNVWKNNVTEQWAAYLLNVLLFSFPVASLANMSAISIERLHATFWPFRHRVMSKWVYGLIIAVVWVTAELLSIATIVLWEFKGPSYYFYLWNSFNLICLLVICFSYAFIVITVRCGAQPQHHGAASRERKLTMTLLIVSFVSLLLWLPYLVISFIFFSTDIFISLSPLAIQRLNDALVFSFYANSLVNPIIYATRIPEFRRALVALFRKRSQQLNQAEVIPLRDM